MPHRCLRVRQVDPSPQIIKPAVTKGLLHHDKVVYPHASVSGIDNFDRLISITQDPIGHTVRSDVGTYVDLFGHMHLNFASLPEAKTKGLQPKHFSYNHRRGMCTACWGMGYKKVEMHFLPPVH